MPHITRTSLQVRSGLDGADFDELWVTVRAALLCQENRIGLAGPTLGRGSFEEWVTASLESWAGKMYWGTEVRGVAKKKLVWGSDGEVGDREEIRKVFRGLVVYIAGNVRYAKKVRAISSTGRREYSPAVSILGGGKDVIGSDGSCVVAQPGGCTGLEFSIPYMPPPDEFPRFLQESTSSAPVQRSKHRYPTRQRPAPLRINLGEVIPKLEGRRRRGNLTIQRRKIARISEPVAPPLASLPFVRPSHSRLPTPLPSARTPPGLFPPRTLVKYSECSSPQYKPPQYAKTYSSHKVFVTCLGEGTSTLPGSTLVKLVYVSDAQTLEAFLKKLRQKWSIPEVKGVRVEVEGQVFDVDLEDERDWEVVLGVVELVGSIGGVVVVCA